MVRVASVKMLRLLAFARHVETDTINVQKPMSATLKVNPDTARYNRYSGIVEKNPPCNAEDNLHVGLIIIEAWFRGY